MIRHLGNPPALETKHSKKGLELKKGHTTPTYEENPRNLRKGARLGAIALKIQESRMMKEKRGVIVVTTL